MEPGRNFSGKNFLRHLSSHLRQLTSSLSVTRHTNMSGAQKFDQGKLRWDLVPIEALEKVVDVFTYGAKKYGDRNWEKGIELDRLYAAAMRHLAEAQKGVALDEESGKPHLAHAAANLLMWMHLQDSKQVIT